MLHYITESGLLILFVLLTTYKTGWVQLTLVSTFKIIQIKKMQNRKFLWYKNGGKMMCC